MQKILTGTIAVIACSLLMTIAAFMQPVEAQPQNAQAKLEAAQRRAQAAQLRALQRQQRQTAAAQQRTVNQQRREQAEATRDHLVPDALQALQTAKVDLESGNHDYHGHRAAALRATDQAISLLNGALAWDRQHEKFSASTPSAVGAGIKPSIPVSPLPRGAREDVARDHFVTDALQVLQTAAANLQRGNHDYHGYRAQALTKTENAIRHAQQAIEWDKTHPGK